jgi:adenylylsulfate reductase subunit B
MSIQIRKAQCVGCGSCIEACPGNLIKKNPEGKAEIKHIRDCWGCTSCLKECKFGAISFFLGADIGGRGSRLTVTENGDLRDWTVEDILGNTQTIHINMKDANKY